MFFFFFQAEDGIRDADVTGVQTCALPISWRSSCAFHGPLTGGGLWARETRTNCARRSRAAPESIACSARRTPSRIVSHTSAARSEERRVGEEGRSRGSPYH